MRISPTRIKTRAVGHFYSGRAVDVLLSINPQPAHISWQLGGNMESDTVTGSIYHIAEFVGRIRLPWAGVRSHLM